MDLPGEYQVSATFNVADLSLFDADSRMNPFEERGNDIVQGNVQDDQQVNDLLLVPEGPIARSRAKKIKEAMLGLVKETMAATSKENIGATTSLKMGLLHEEPSWVTLIQALD